MSTKTVPIFHAVLVADSRAWNFNDKYSTNTGLSDLYIPQYIIQRGGTAGSLAKRYIEFVQKANFSSNDWLIVKIAIGINDILEKSHNDGVKQYRHCGTDTALRELLRFRSTVYDVWPNTIASFIAIPPAHLIKAIAHQGLVHNKVNIAQQRRHLNDILELNSNLQSLNKHQTGLPFRPHCCCWDSAIVVHSKKPKKNGGYRHRSTVSYKALYDGIHAKRDFKNIWYYRWHISATRDAINLKRFLRKQTRVHL